MAVLHLILQTIFILSHNYNAATTACKTAVSSFVVIKISVQTYVLT